MLIKLKTSNFVNITEKLHVFTTEIKVINGLSTFRLLCNSEQKWANEKKYFMTRLFIKLPGVLMKEMKKKQKWKCIFISTGAMKIYLVWIEPKQSILTILKISVKTKLYSKLLSKNYIDYFSLHTYFLKNQKVILSCNRDFCNFKLKFSANWHKSLIHY